MVTSWTAAASESSRRVRSSPRPAALCDLLAEPGQEGRETLALGQGHLVERLTDVPKVGQATVAADLGEHPGR